MRRAKKAAAVLFLLTLVCAAVYIVSNIIGSFVFFTSFPWWSAFVFAAIYFGPVLAAEALVWLILHMAGSGK